MTTRRAEPITPGQIQDVAHLTIAATYKDPATGATFVHSDLVRVQEPWAEESHIPPMSANESLGDVESFAAYVSRYAVIDSAFLTWNSRGLHATLDYDERGHWHVDMPFRSSPAWVAWTQFACNRAMPQKQAVESLEDLASDIVEPAAADLMAILRGLRATINAKADAELRPDGTSKVAFEKDARVQTANALDLPASFTIAIPVLKGHVNAEGKPVVYQVQVRVRTSVDDNAKLTLRFSIPNAERILEAVYAERVQAAQALLGGDFILLRAAD